MFIESALNVAQQTVILFMLIGVGVILAKRKMLSEQTIRQMTYIILYAVTPAVIIKAFNTEFDPAKLNGLLIMAGLAFISLVVGIGISSMFFRKEKPSQRIVLRYSIIYSNCGFMALPLTEAVIGAEGVFYGSVFLVVFLLFVWTHGIVLMSGRKSDVSARKMFINAGTIGIAIALPLFLFSIELPAIPQSFIGFMSSLNTPLSMIVIGSHLAGISIKTALSNGKIWLVSAVRLLAVPAIMLGVMLLVRQFVFLPVPLMAACMVATSAPCAAICTLFAQKYNHNTVLSSQAIMLSTFLSIVTMPLFIAVTLIF